MNLSNFGDQFNDAIKQVDRIIDSVEERGYDDIPEESDDYSLLLDQFEFRKLIIFELYEGYFQPKRHEFELAILTRLVDAVVASKTASFFASAAVGGIVGNTVYDLLKNALQNIIRRFKKTKRSRDAFREINIAIEKLREFFESRDQADIKEICAALELDAYKVAPLMKLLGFKCNRKGKHEIWAKAGYLEAKKNRLTRKNRR